MGKRSKRKSPNPRKHNHRHHHKPVPHSADPKVKLKGNDPTLPPRMRRQALHAEDMDNFDNDTAA